MCVYMHIYISLLLNSGANFVKFVQNKIILEVPRKLHSEKEASELCLHFLGSLSSLKCFHPVPYFLLRLYNQGAYGDIEIGSLTVTVGETHCFND